ncbi:MAG: sulfite exporter TauE/SafE family protein [Oscillospiraceae bacterium]|nr:sulfite exporter TauE/SafE family protein [Oscillospiraceae bacterium]
MTKKDKQAGDLFYRAFWIKLVKSKTFTAVSGLAVGIINGLLGAGGGMLAVPILKKIGLDQRKAHANSIVVILPISAVSAALYLLTGRVTLTSTWSYMPAGILGAFLGAKLLHRLPAKLLRRIFGVFMLWAGVRLLWK